MDKNVKFTVPCTIAYSYIRIEVDGSVKPCCVCPIKMGDIQINDLNHIWNSSPMEAFRLKTSLIHVEQYHLLDQNFAFCKECPHQDLLNQICLIEKS